MVYFESEKVYVASATTNAARLVKIDALIDALLLSSINSMTNADVQGYMLNDGQTVIKTEYRDPAQIANTIKSLENMKQYYLNQLNGRRVRLMDGKNFFNNRNF